MIEKILIANRGEIALRIIRACREMGIATVAVHSDIDREALFVTSADESFCVGPASVAQSYLNIPNLISAALISGAQAIHPGYGFLAENTEFVEICHQHNLTFIGPSSEAMAMMGDKASARETAVKAGVPLMPGTGILESEQEALDFAKEHGYPVMLKASAGGGGKGMRIAHDPQELSEQLKMAKMEAKSAFGDDRVYAELFLEKGRHVEVQIMADQHGHVVHLGERDCSSQRRNQKLVEESPCPVLEADIRQEMGAMAIKIARACDYVGAGTVEFLYDAKNRKFYFLEMNTRIQVEHPVTEMVTGFDLVKEQIRVAMGYPLSFYQEDVQLRGHSIECRINAEKPDQNFMPSCGLIERLHFPGGPGVRIDSYLTSGSRIEPYYDSLIAKVITYGKDREEARLRMLRVLKELLVEGITTTQEFHYKLLQHKAFIEGEIDTKFIEREFMNEKVGATL